MYILDWFFDKVNTLLKLRSLKHQLRFWGFVLILLPSISLMLIYSFFELQHIKQERLDNLQIIIAMQQDAIDRWFAERSAVIRDMRNWPVIKAKDQDPVEINARIREFIDSQEEFFSIIYIDKSGISVPGQASAQKVDYSDRIYFPAVREGKEYITDVLIGRGGAEGIPIIVFAVPVLDEDQQFRGAIAGTVKLTTIDKIMKSFQFGRSGETYLVDSNGLMITKSRYAEAMVKDGVAKEALGLTYLVDTQAFRLATKGSVTGNAEYADYGGREIMGAYRWLLKRDWVIIGEVDKDEVLEPYYQQIGIMFGWFLVLIIASLPFSLVLANRLETPIRRVIAGANAMKSGDYTHRIEQDFMVSSVTEMRDLCNIFNYMAENISIQNTTLNSANKELTIARDAALEASIAKSQFLANMSHEIRTPLNAILGMADLLWDSKLTTEQKKFVQVTRTSGENLLSLINDILDLSKVEAGRFNLDNSDFDLNDIVEKSCELLALKAHEKGIELSHYVASGIPAAIKGDGARLKQVIINLVGNAIKFTEAGEVVLEVRPTFRMKNNSQEFLFVVRDTGIGIPEDKLEEIFDRFTQVDASNTRKYGGTGLGLAISRRLVELMDGHIWVESQLGQGSTFFFTAYFEIGSNLKNDQVLPAPDSFKDLKILVIDDNATNRLILKETLVRWGANVVEADSGLNGLAQLEAASANDTRFSLVLLDGRMPVMDGFEVARRIQEKPQFSGITIMMLTSNMLSLEIDKCSELGIVNCLVKPVKRLELYTSILAALGRSQLATTDDSTTSQLAEPMPLRPLKILLVEDSADNRLLIEAYIKRSPHSVDIAENGQVAVQKFRVKNYDIVFMDMQMPIMDGYQATRKIREWELAEGRKRTPIVALTAYAMQEDVIRTSEAGCDGHLTKPIKKTVLMEALRKFTEGIE